MPMDTKQSSWAEMPLSFTNMNVQKITKIFATIIKKMARLIPNKLCDQSWKGYNPHYAQMHFSLHPWQ
jgi:hypothetical protein